MAQERSELASAVLAPVEAAHLMVLADQDASTRDYVTRVLAPGHRVETFADGQAALNEARKSPPDLILIDAATARTGGSGFLRALRQDPATREVPIVLLSNHDSQLEPDAGADDYLTPPFTPTEISARVATLLELARLRRTVAELRERLHAAGARAQAAEHAKEEFLTALGHELRNPLSPIVAGVELMKLRGGRVFLRERIAIERQAGHLIRLVDDMLDAARLAQHRMTLHKEVTELGPVVVEAREIASPLIEHRRQHLDMTIPNHGMRVLADRSRLAQALSNLLINAAKYTRRGGVIRVTSDHFRNQVVVRVTDHGAGIPAELLPRIFDLFTQGPRGPERSKGGVGLGLAIARGIIALHGGTIEAYSEGAGKGAQFTVRLQEADGAGPQPKPPEPQPLHPTRAKRLLVVDDNRDSAEMLTELLQVYGYTTQVAYDGPSAINTALAFNPDVALVDIGLPAMDGYEVARRMRQMPQLHEVRLIAVTCYGNDSDRRRSRQAGFNQHLVKPVDMEELKRAINFES